MKHFVKTLCFVSVVTMSHIAGAATLTITVSCPQLTVNGERYHDVNFVFSDLGGLRPRVETTSSIHTRTYTSTRMVPENRTRTIVDDDGGTHEEWYIVWVAIAETITKEVALKDESTLVQYAMSDVNEVVDATITAEGLAAGVYFDHQLGSTRVKVHTINAEQVDQQTCTWL